MLPNLAIMGKLRSGKSLVGDYLAEKYGYTQFAFGDALKDDFHRRYPEVPRDPKPRAGYQFHGQFMREQIDADIWIRKCLAEVQRQYYAHLDFRAVITDVRQPNEYHALISAGYMLIRVEAPESLRIHRAIESGDTFNLRDLTHDTETALDGFAADFTIQNDAGLPELYAQVDAIMDLLRSSSGGEAA